MTLYNVIAELNEKKITEERADILVTALQGYSPAVSAGMGGRPSITISLPADSLRQATTSGIAVIEAAAGSAVVAAEVLLTDDFDRRNGLEPVPDLMSVTQVAEELGQSRQAVLKAIDAQRFVSATRVGDSWAIARAEVEARKASMWFELENVPFQYTGITLTGDEMREVFGPMYDALRLIGWQDAYDEYLAKVAGEAHNAAYADEWESAYSGALSRLETLGKNIGRVSIRPSKLPGRTVGSR